MSGRGRLARRCLLPLPGFGFWPRASGVRPFPPGGRGSSIASAWRSLSAVVAAAAAALHWGSARLAGVRRRLGAVVAVPARVCDAAAPQQQDGQGQNDFSGGGDHGVLPWLEMMKRVVRSSCNANCVTFRSRGARFLVGTLPDRAAACWPRFRQSEAVKSGASGRKRDRPASAGQHARWTRVMPAGAGTWACAKRPGESGMGHIAEHAWPNGMAHAAAGPLLAKPCKRSGAIDAPTLARRPRVLAGMRQRMFGC